MTPTEVTSNSAVAKGPATVKKLGEPKRYFRRDSQKTIATARVAVKQPKFEGKNEDLRGHVYDCSDARQSDIFVKRPRGK
jgi:hypothetical protein